MKDGMVSDQCGEEDAIVSRRCSASRNNTKFIIFISDRGGEVTPYG